MNGGTALGTSRLWIRLGVAAGGCLVLLLMACTALALLNRDRLAGLFPETVGSWTEAASRVSITVYAPGYVPPGAGEPRIGVSRPIPEVEQVEALYPSGLSISQSIAYTADQDGDRGEPLEVAGAEEAYIGDIPMRMLQVRKGNTWIALTGAPDAELLRVAASLEQVFAPPPTLPPP